MTTSPTLPRFSVDPLQGQASRAPEGPVLIIGGAGTGKTHTLMARIADLIQRGAHPSTITYLTFNPGNAANACKVLHQLPIGPEDHKAIFIGTFHSYAGHFLRQAGSAALGLPPNYTIWDQEAAFRVLNDILTTCPGIISDPAGDEPFRPSDIPDLLAWHTLNQARLPDDPIPPRNGAWLRLIDLYRTEKRRQHTIDLDDLIPLAVNAMEANEDLRARWSNLWSRHLLVDEFQALTPMQYRMIQLMTGPTKSVAIAIDPNQDIYIRRGSNSELLEHFKLDHPNLDSHILKLNHRSRRTLNDAVSNLAEARDMDGLFKTFQVGARPKGSLPTLREFHGNPTSMYYRILTDLQKRHDGGTPWEQMACLYRSQGTFTKVTVPLHRLGMPYRVLGNMANLTDSTTKKFVNLLNCILNPLDTKSFSIAAETSSTGRKRWLTPKAVSDIDRLAQDRNTNLVEASKIYRAAAKRDSTALKNLTKFVNAWEDLNQLLMDPKTTLYALCLRAHTVIYEATAHGIMVNPELEFTKILALAEATPRLPDETLGKHLARFLELMATVPNPGVRSLDNDDSFVHSKGLTFSTIHASPGHEWRVVYFLDACDHLIPGPVGEDRLHLWEELRIFYLACTRATDELVFAHHASSDPTRFINAIDRDVRREIVDLDRTTPQ